MYFFIQLFCWNKVSVVNTDVGRPEVWFGQATEGDTILFPNSMIRSFIPKVQ